MNAEPDHSNFDRALHFGQEQSPREMPNNIEAEQALLGAVLVNNDAFNELPPALEPAHFFEPLHRKIFEVAGDIIRQRRIANPVTIKNHLPADAKVGEMTVSTYLARLASEAVSIVNAKDYAQGIIDAYAARCAIDDAQQIVEEAYQSWMELGFLDKVDEIADGLRRRVQDLKARDVRGPGASYLDVFSAASKRNGAVGVPIAFPELAKVLSEPVFEAGNLYGLLSSSGEGKSSLTMQLIYHAVREGHPVLFLSYDQSASQCVRQMISQVQSIGVQQQNDPMGMMSDSERDACVRFANWIERQPLDIIRCQREGIEKLTAYARRFVKRYANGKTPFVVLDHVGKVKPKDPKLSADRISGDITVEAKSCADETGSAWLVLNQRNGFGDKRDNPRPISADLYGGAGARADYDAVAYLYRAEKYKAERIKIAASDADWKKINKVFAADSEGVAEIGAIKVRFGDPTITEILNFEARYTRYRSKPAESQGRMAI